MITMGRHILHLRFDLPAEPDAELPERLRRLLEGITPRVQMIEPNMAVVDLTGALPYWKLLLGLRGCGVTLLEGASLGAGR
ncbi:hypothetical protein [Streptomyces sp. BK340]|uniref:hypothetical protein n=1 Tax=Streptomyces sp. BK340 TaxID=2572903 RepID=UPI0011A48376|nr:hypothetical protein [Streptomyces sp. BK340]TVZ90535.1 hypothetical protein FB157_111194 [Streptomyces sp. BK340]